MSHWALVGNQLALGVEPLDAVLGTPLARSIHIDVERPGEPWLRDDAEGFARRAGADRPPMSRHASGRHAMVWRSDVGDSVSLRLYDRRRIWVPRRLTVPLPPIDEYRSDHDHIDRAKVERRIRRPVLFPGVAWDLLGGATALRSRVLRDDAAVRWAWITARRVGETEVAMRTRADDRGEFLLVLGASTLALSELDPQVELDLEAFGPSLPVAVDDDPLADLPIESLASLADLASGDPSAEGRGDPPATWVSLGTARVTLELGRTVSDQTSLSF